MSLRAADQPPNRPVMRLYAGDRRLEEGSAEPAAGCSRATRGRGERGRSGGGGAKRRQSSRNNGRENETWTSRVESSRGESKRVESRQGKSNTRRIRRGRKEEKENRIVAGRKLDGDVQGERSAKKRERERGAGRA